MEWSGSPTLVQAERAHRTEVTCLDAWGGRLATGGGDRALRLWRWARGLGWQPAAEARVAHRYGVTVVRWSRAGCLLASGGVEGAVRVWCGRSLAARRTLAAPAAAAVRALCWAGGGGARLLSGHDDGAVCVWAVPRDLLLARLVPHEGALYALATLAGDALLLTACTTGVLKVFDLVELSGAGCTESGAKVSPLMWVDGAHDMGALCADADEHGDVVATGGHDARIRVWRVCARSLQEGAALEGHSAAVTALRWGAGAGPACASGRLLASASLDRSARLWAPDAGACLHVVPAHPRYLTCIALSRDQRYMVTGSNDRSFRMWSLSELTLDDDLEPACTALSHFAVGDLQGIGPVSVEGTEDLSTLAQGQECSGGVQCVWSVQAHGGAVNSLSAQGEVVASASSDGSVKVWRRVEAQDALQVVHALAAHQYPALVAELGAAGSVLLTAGLDGCAFLWDVQTGVQVRALSLPCASGEAGGGGVRAGRVSSHRPPMLLLATDDGIAPLWRLADTDPDPYHIYTGHTEAVTCCAWSGDGRVVATGAASGELRVLAPPAPGHLYHNSHAHDLGVTTCDFATDCANLQIPEAQYLLATGGCDSLIKLWLIEILEDLQEYAEGQGATVRLVRVVEAHGAAVACVRWGAGGALVSAGEDRWARVWCVGGAGASVAAAGAVPARGAGGALAALALGPLLAVGTMSGELALWRVSAHSPAHLDHTSVCFWGAEGVAAWLKEYVVTAPGSNVTSEEESELLLKIQGSGITGVNLMDDPIEELLEQFGYGGEVSEERCAAVRARLRDEIEWLRRAPPSAHQEGGAAHGLLCPLTHRVLREPARAADGFSYERAALREWLLAAGGSPPRSPVSNEPLASAVCAPNYNLREQLRAFLDDTTLH